MSKREERLTRVLLERLEGAGFPCRPARRDYGGDLLVDLGDQRFTVQLKLAHDARTEQLLGHLARGLLESKSRSTVRSIPVVGVPKLSDRMLKSLTDFVDRVAPHQAWGVFDGLGRVRIVANGLAIDLPTDPDFEWEPPVSSAPRSLFTDVHQWLLKTLLAPRLPIEWLSAARESGASVRWLARAADVSIPSAGRFLAVLEEEGFLARGKRKLRLLRLRELLDAWREANRPKSKPLGMRWLLTPRDLETKLYEAMSSLAGQGLATCVGLHHACRQLGFGFVRGAKVTVLVERLEPAAAAFREQGLVKSGPHEEPDLFLDVPRARRSSFRGAVQRDGVLVSDVLQAWLDVSWHPVRGREQADVLWENAIQPYLLEVRGTR